MNDTTEDNPIDQIMEIIIEQGFGGMDQAMTILINEAMKIERASVLQATAYERTPNRQGHANGYKPKNVKSRLGNLGLQVPQVRGGIEFYPSALEKGERSERALKLAMAEMYIKGVTTRKVSGVLQKLCGLDFSSADVSRASAMLDKELNLWRNRPISEVAYLMLDARYEKVRMNGSVVSCAVLVATGVLADGKRSVLGVAVSMSEAEVHWRDFLLSLKKRGMHGVKLVTSDDHSGLHFKAAWPAFPGSGAKCIFSVMPRPMCPRPICEKVSLRTSETSSMPPTEKRPIVCWSRPSKSIQKRLGGWPFGWKKTYRKGWRSLPCQRSIADACARPIWLNGRTERSNAGPACPDSFQMRHRC